VACTEDATVSSLPPREKGGGESAARLLVPTFAEEMKRQKGSRVVSLSLKPRSAIMMAGHSADAVTWLAESGDHWETSSAFVEAPVPQLRAFEAANPIRADFRKRWTPSLPAPSYVGEDAGLAEAPPPGWTRRFPHVLNGRPGERGPAEGYYAQWERSPYADAYLGRMAAALVESMQLGRRDTTDVLAISFSTPDLLGHGFGPRSQEVQDLYVHLDRTLGALLERLDALVGAGRYVVAFSSDHGVQAIPEQAQAEGRDAGRLDGAGIRATIDGAAQQALGPGSYVARIVGNDIYLLSNTLERLAKASGALDAVLAAVAKRPGIARVFHAGQLEGATGATDAHLRAAALSFVKGRSGDLVISPKPGWMTSAAGTTHGSANPDDQRVPIIFYGTGIRPGRYDTPSTPADIAPTLADIFGIALPRAEGVFLRDARD
jgi:predicted AlkP superfamily pyrophosphatase or phosphodiesterase